MFFVIEGTYELTVGDQTSIAGPGTIVFIPRNVVHRFKNVRDTTARMLDRSLPGGQDHYFEATCELAAGGGFTGEKGDRAKQEVRHALRCCAALSCTRESCF